MSEPNASDSGAATRTVSEERRLQAVLLDMDGTLVESEHLWNEAEASLVAELGGQWTAEDHRRNVGSAVGLVARYVIDLTGARHLTPRQVGDMLYGRFRNMLEGGAEPRPGAKELVRLLAESHVPVALVTSTERQLIDAAIGAIGLESFDDSVAGDEVAATKPDPDPYLKAARRLGVDPAGCVAFEDSEVGVASAADAGCVTVAVPNHVHIPAREGVVFRESLEGIDLDWLESLVVGR